MAAHRLLAMVRAEREGFIKLSVLPDESAAVEQLERIFIKRNPSLSGLWSKRPFGTGTNGC
ncbi:MAG: hypothetical protein ACLR8Y_05235 [Alistipes indistinctus]